MIRKISLSVDRILPFAKAFLTIQVISICLDFVQSEASVADTGLKAAFLATGAATLLFVGLLPDGEGRGGYLVRLITGFCSALLAFSAGYLWVHSEPLSGYASTTPQLRILLAIASVSGLVGGIYHLWITVRGSGLTSNGR